MLTVQQSQLPAEFESGAADDKETVVVVGDASSNDDFSLVVKRS